MFPNRRSYDASYFGVPHAGTDTVKRGLHWLLTWGDPKWDGLIHVPVKDQLEYSDLAAVLGDPVSRRLRNGDSLRIVAGTRLVRAATERTFPPRGWRGGPVLVLWPNAKMLEKLHDSPSVKALCVVPWTLDEVQPWALAVGAQDLTTPGKTASAAPTIADPVVEKALESVTDSVNLSTGLAHSRDKTAAVTTFRILKKGGHTWTGDEVYAWAISNGWSADGASELRSYAEGVLSGKRYRVGRASWRNDILSIWRREAESQ